LLAAIASPVDGATRPAYCQYALCPVIVDKSPYWFIVAREDLEISDDWDMASMVATGSVTIATKNTFVPDGWGIEIARLMSSTGHCGTFHTEDIYRQSFSVLSMSTPSICLGALVAGVELGRERLRTSKPFGIARIERVPSRVRWVRAYEAARVARLIRDTVTENAIQRAQSGRHLTLEDEACMGLHGVSVMQGIKYAARLLVDGFGTSGYRADDPIRRMSSDVAMISTHLLGGDYDIVMDRHARWVLGLGMDPGDPMTRFA
jgi:3-hydroxy-9,10-secoandrosta-1,3,5(10)-triene-9,17-dione monooxygenase